MTNLLANGRLDPASLRRRFGAGGRLQIGDFLAVSAATDLLGELARSRSWRHVVSGAERLFEIPCDQFDAMEAGDRSMIASALHSEAARGFRFQYDLIRVPDRPDDHARAGPMLGAFADFMNGAALPILREITGEAQLCFADAQATRYRAGDFLTRHDDALPHRRRRYAYVFGLTHDWRPEWGGLLLFHDQDGVSQAMVPAFNSLCLFEVPQSHSVSYVAPYAAADRISVTGWLFDEAPA